MNILYVSRPIAPPWNEGSKNLTWQLASRLTRHQAHLLTTAAGERFFSPQIQWHRPYRQEKFTVIEKLRLMIYLFLTSNPADLLHLFFVPTSFTSYILSFASRLHKIKCVQTIPCLPANLPPPAKMTELFFADQIVVYSQYTQCRLREMGITNVTHIDVGIDVNRFSQSRPDPHLRTRLGLDKEDVLILFAGEYTRLGGVDVLKRIMPALVAKFARCHFLIACRILLPADRVVEADLMQTVQAQWITDHVHFLGEVKDFPALLKASDIFLFPVTDMHGKIDTPLSILEAMAAGLPVITHNIIPLNEIFGRDSIALATHDDELIERLLLLASDTVLRAQEGSRLQTAVQKRYNLVNMVEAYEALYDSLG